MSVTYKFGSLRLNICQYFLSQITQPKLSIFSMSNQYLDNNINNQLIGIQIMAEGQIFTIIEVDDKISTLKNSDAPLPEQIASAIDAANRTVTTPLQLVVKNKRYRHYKGQVYQVINQSIHTETAEKLVNYYCVDDPVTIYSRPLEMFSDGRFQPQP